MVQDSGKYHRKEDLSAAILVLFVQKETFPIIQVKTLELTYENPASELSLDKKETKNICIGIRVPYCSPCTPSLTLSISLLYAHYHHLIMCKLLSGDAHPL